VQIDYEGKSYLFDFEDIDVLQAKVVEAAGYRLDTLPDALERLEAGALQALWWLILAQNGVRCDIKKANVKFLKLAKAFAVAQAAEEAPEEAAPESPKAKRSNKSSGNAG
jgi:hypothetical protein